MKIQAGGQRPNLKFKFWLKKQAANNQNTVKVKGGDNDSRVTCMNKHTC